MEKQIELEIAWLLEYLPAEIDESPSSEIFQGYLEHDDSIVKDERVRKKREFTLIHSSALRAVPRRRGFVKKKQRK